MHSTPKTIKLYIKEFWENKEREIEWMQWHSWQTGQYVLAAIGTAFSKRCKYPPNPIAKKEESVKEIAKRTNKSEAEIQQNLMYMSMRVRQANANLEQKRKERKEDYCTTITLLCMYK